MVRLNVKKPPKIPKIERRIKKFAKNRIDHYPLKIAELAKLNQSFVAYFCMSEIHNLKIWQ